MFDGLWLRGQHARVSRLGDELRRLREAQGLTQIDVATALGQKTNASISQYENGHAAPSTKHWKPLAKVLGVTPEHLRQFGAPFRPTDPRSRPKDSLSVGLQATNGSATVPPHITEELRRESEAVLLKGLGERGFNTLVLLRAAIGFHPQRVDEICDAVDEVVRPFIADVRPKARRRSGGVR